ncbi:MAG: N-acetyltransferase [Phycisphaerales bacterium]|nr:N-acetyltransferase [Phycisphaerales bacterium]
MPELVHVNVKIHQTACVDSPCDIGEGSSIWHYSHIMPNCTIGTKVNIGQNVVVSPGVTIGHGCKIQNNVSIYTGVTLEDYVFCGPSMVFTNVINPRCEIPRRDQYKKTRVGYGASIGANATIVCGHNIGRFAFIGAGAVITKDVPDYALMVGVPAKRSGWACRCGDILPAIVNDTTTCQCGNQYKQSSETGEPRLVPIKEHDPVAVQA